MHQWIVAFLFGVLGGAAGALCVGLIEGPPPEAPETAVDRPNASTEVLRRLDAIDGRLEILAGSTALATRPVAGRTDGDPVLEGGSAEDRLAQRLEARVARTLESKWAELTAGSSGPPTTPEPEERKPRMALSEVAAELELTSMEEAQLRDIYKKAEDRFLAILAEPDGDPDAIREEVRRAVESGDRTAAMTLATKYIPKIVPKLGEVMAIELDREAEIRETLGAERATELDNYSIEEADPMGLRGGGFGIEARARAPR